ncbi:MAG TPA: efflux transporter outer membrane subunit [Bryobacteraceae bacterium]|nr:efflux transporter outer membrane subunit [Bryobacteraceae bacterium]
MKGACAAVALVAGLSLSSCTMGPNYKRPAVDVPATYRAPSQPETAQSLGDEKWWTVFGDEELQKLIRTALAQNYNLQIAANRVLQEQAQLSITRASEFPTVSGGPAISGIRSPSIPGVFQGYQYVAPALTISASWVPDFWGQYRRATEAARANLLGAEWNRRAVMSTVVSSVAAAYFQLRAFDLALDIARQTLASRQESLKLTETLENGGAASLEDVRQAQQLVETAAATIPDTEREIGQQENSISILLGENPAEISRGRKLTEEAVPPVVPAGLPSALLERRPDIREAEQQLIAANAQIGVAKAELFPQISLTGSGGFESIGLHNLFTLSSGVWNFSAAAVQPIFEGGRLRGNVRLAEAQQQQMVLSYKQTIQRAFGDVSNALIAYRKYRQYREHLEALAHYAEDAATLSDVRYKGGVTSYLEVLTNQTNYFSAELTLVQARLNERLSLVQLYNALGGGWQQ